MSVDPPKPSTEEIALAAAIAAGDVDDQLDERAPGVAESSVVLQARRRRRTILLIRKIAITVVGVTILGAGIAMLFIPGPGGLAIVLGLFVLSLEYEWAERRLDQVRDKVVEAAHKAAASRFQTTVAVISSIGMIVGGVIWALQEDWPFSSWYTGGTLAFGGVLALATIGWSIIDLRNHRARDLAPGPTT